MAAVSRPACGVAAVYPGRGIGPARQQELDGLATAAARGLVKRALVVAAGPVGIHAEIEEEPDPIDAPAPGSVDQGVAVAQVLRVAIEQVSRGAGVEPRAGGDEGVATFRLGGDRAVRDQELGELEVAGQERVQVGALVVVEVGRLRVGAVLEQTSGPAAVVVADGMAEQEVEQGASRRRAAS